MRSIPNHLSLLYITMVLQVTPALGDTFDSHNWQEVNPTAQWAPRAGQQVLNINGVFYLIAGRSPLDLPIPGASTIW